MSLFPAAYFPATVILRHRKENLKKCSLKGLEGRNDFLFLTYPKNELPQLNDYVLLDVEGEPLSASDYGKGLLLIDGTWRYAEKMIKHTLSNQTFLRRSLPGHYKTAYPRCQEGCPLPDQGLASIEALYVAYKLMGRNTAGLLDNYYWKDHFINSNFLF